jgi:hypothetical protein
MVSKTVFAALALAITTPTSAYIRFGCANHVIEERADPVVNPGTVAGHAHKVAGFVNITILQKLVLLLTLLQRQWLRVHYGL